MGLLRAVDGLLGGLPNSTAATTRYSAGIESAAGTFGGTLNWPRAIAVHGVFALLNRYCVVLGLCSLLVAGVLVPASSAYAACQHPADGSSLDPVGDINGNGVVNVADALCAVLVSAWDLAGETPGDEPGCAESVFAADVDCSLSTDVADAVAVISVALGTGLPSGVEVDEEGCPVACCDAGAGATVTANAGDDASTCVTPLNLAATVPATGDGQWTVVSGSATFADDSSPATEVNGLTLGANTLRWTVTEGCESDFDDVVITLEESPGVVDAGSSQDVCGDSAVLGAASGAGSWTVDAGTASFSDSSSPTATASGLSVGPNVLRWTVTTAACGSDFDTTTIQRFEDPSTADAGSDFSTCDEMIPLSAVTPMTGIGTWTDLTGTGTFDDAQSPSAVAMGLAVGPNTLEWRVESGACAPSVDTIVVTRNAPATAADAGPDQNLNPNTPSTTLAANTPVAGTGEWEVVEGSGILADSTDPNTTVTNLSAGLNVFQWTITNGPCVSSAEVAVVRPIACSGTQTVTSEADLQNLRVCQSMTNLFVEGVTEALDLSWLTNLETVSQNIEIIGNPDLVSLTGLENLTSIGGNITVEGNAVLADLSGLSGVGTVGGYLRIEDNPTLTSLGLTSLTSVGTDLVVFDNLSLPQCDAEAFGATLSGALGNNLVILDNEPDALGVCVGSTNIQGLNCFNTQVAIENDGEMWHLAGCTTHGANLLFDGPEVTDLSPLSSLEVITGSVRIRQTPNLVNLQGLNSLTTISGYMEFFVASGLTTFEGMDNLQSIGEYLNIFITNGVTDIDGFPSLESVGQGIFLVQNQALTDVSGFNALLTLGNGRSQQPETSFYIQQNNLMTDITGFQNLVSTTGTIWLERSNLLQDISGFASLTNIGLDLEIHTNNSLTEITGFAELDTVQRDILIYDNRDLIGIDGFVDLDTITGQLFVEDNDDLASISGFPSLTMAGDILVNNNPSLTAIDGFDTLAMVGVAPPDALQFSANPLLTDISGLSALQSTGGDLRIIGNPLLTSGAALAGLEYVGGSLRFEQNDSLMTLGLDALGVGVGNGIGENLAIFDNVVFDQCLGFDLRDQVVNDPNGLGIGGSVSIALNDDSNGCSGVVPTIPVGDCPQVHLVQSPLDLLTLASCTSVGGLEIVGASVVNMAGLENLTSITGDFIVTDNLALASVAELTSLASIGGTFNISRNNALTAIDGISALDTIGGDFILSQNQNLVTLSGLSSLDSIGGDLNLFNNNALLNLAGLQELDTIGAEFRIVANQGLTGMAHLTSLTSVGSIYWENNGQLVSNVGMENVTTVSGNMFLRSHNSLTSLAGFAGLQTIGGDVTFRQLYVLQSLSGFDSLTSIGGFLSLNELDAITDLQGMGSLTTLGSYMWVSFCDGLTSTAGMSSLQTFSSFVRFFDNPELQNVQGWTSLTTIASHLQVSGSPKLAVVDFPALEDVTSYLSVLNNSSNAASLSVSFDALLNVGGDFRVENNPALTSVSLAQLPALNDDFIIFDNASYPECEAQALADAIDDTSSGGGGIVGTITIGQNDTTATCP